MEHSRSRERGTRSTAGQYSTNMSRRSSHQTSLPSFRDLLPPHLHEQIDADSVGILPGTMRVTSPASSEFDAMSNAGSVTLSPNVPHPQMPSVAAGFDELAGRYGETVPSRSIPRVQTPHAYHGSSPGIHTTSRSLASRYSQPTPKNEYSTTSRTSPILPPIRSIQTLPDRSLHGSDQQLYPSLMSPNVAGFSSSVGVSHDFSSSQSSHTRPTLYGSSQRGHHTYPLYQEIPERPTKDYLKVDSLNYDTSLRNSTYGEPYSMDLDHSPRSTSHPHHSGFGVLGDTVESRNKRRRGNLPKPVTEILKQWFHEHLDHPYPSEDDKQMFIARTGLSISQISNWFINARRRQLPALRNQIRSHDHERSPRHRSLSDTERTQSSSLSPSL